MSGAGVSDNERTVPTLVFIIGPPAVGKMTVGQALARRTGFRLFHTHQVIDFLTEYFAYGTPPFDRLVRAYKRLFFEEAAASGLNLITTNSWPFDEPVQTEIIRQYVQPYVERGGRVCFVELLAPLEVRLARNLTDNRQRHKKVDWSTEEALRRGAAVHRYDSGGALPLELPLLRIETEHLSAEATAERIRAFYGLP